MSKILSNMENHFFSKLMKMQIIFLILFITSGEKKIHIIKNELYIKLKQAHVIISPFLKITSTICKTVLK